MICMKKRKFCSHLRAKVRRQGQPGIARAQPCILVVLHLPYLVQSAFRNVGFGGVEKTGVHKKKPLGAKERTNNKLNTHMALIPGFKPGHIGGR